MEENKKPSNPSAFPLALNLNGKEYRGMTLRDYFANSAMQALITNGKLNPSQEDLGLSIGAVISKRAYVYADAMLKQREL